MVSKLLTTVGNLFVLPRLPNHGSGSNWQTTNSCQKPRPLDRTLKELEEQLDPMAKGKFYPLIDISGEVTLSNPSTPQYHIASGHDQPLPKWFSINSHPPRNVASIDQDKLNGLIFEIVCNIRQSNRLLNHGSKSTGQPTISYQEPRPHDQMLNELEDHLGPTANSRFHRDINVTGVATRRRAVLYETKRQRQRARMENLRRSPIGLPRPDRNQGQLNVNLCALRRLHLESQIHGYMHEIIDDRLAQESSITIVGDHLHCDKDSLLFYCLATTQHIRVQCIVEYVDSNRTTRHILYGKEYPSDATGDGPRKERKLKSSSINQEFAITDQTISRLPIEDIHVGITIQVQLETFSKLEDYGITLNDPQDYCIEGQYLEIDKQIPNRPQYLLSFEELDCEYWLSSEWVQTYGRYLSLPRILYQRSRPRGDTTVQREEPLQIDLSMSGLEEILTSQTDGVCSNERGVSGVNFLNINRFYVDNDLPLFHWLKLHHNIGISCILDSRHTKATMQRVRKLWGQLVPGGKVWGTTPTVKSRIGGAMFLCDDRISNGFRKLYQDPSKLGLVQEISFWSPSGLIRIISIYWPMQLQHDLEMSQQLIADLIRWQDNHWYHQDPNKYMQEIIESRLRKEAYLTIIGGDWNAERNSTRLSFLDDLNLHAVHEPDFSTHYSGLIPKRHIDHIFTSRTAHGKGYCVSPGIHCFTDHRPIWGYFPIAASSHFRSHQPTAPTLKLRNVALVDRVKLNNSLAQILPTLSDEPATWLKQITEQVVQKLTVKLPKQQLQYWNPKVQAHILWLKWLLRNTTRLSQQELITPNDKANLEQKFQNVSKPTIEEWENIKTNSLIFQGRISRQDIDLAIAKEFNNLHAKKRQEEYNSFKNFDDKLESSPSLLYRYYGAPRKQTALQLIHHDGRVIAEPEHIHRVMTEYFAHRFAQPTQPLPEDLWTFFQSFENFSQTVAHHKIPLSLLRIIHETIIHVGTTDDAELSFIQRDNITKQLSDLSEGPSFGEFKEMVKRSPGGRSGGPSGLTYDAIKLLDDPILQQIHQRLVCLWKQGSLPSWMAVKALCLIPKTDDEIPTPEQFRPIMLIEPLRKLFIKSMITKIRKTWERAGILSPNQYGFLSGRSCANGIIQLTNAIEHANATNTSLFMSTYDIKSAFDSVQRPIAQLALIRLGVPPTIAKLLAFIDVEDKIQIQTPYAKSNSEHCQTFSSHIGTGQGDVQSPLIWTAVMDILLNTVKRSTVSNLCFPTGDGKYAWCQDPAFADDFINLSRTLAGLQDKANIYSAVCLCMGLTLATTKFRAFSINSPERNNSITIHGPRWQPYKVKLETAGAIKYLGSLQQMDASSSTQRRNIEQQIRSITQRLQSKMGKPHVMLTYIRTALLPKLIYPASFSSIEYGNMQEWNRLVGALMKSRLHLPASFPNLLLYAPARTGGLGLPMISDEVNKRKLDLFHLYLRSDFQTRKAMEGIIYRHTLNSPDPETNLQTLEATQSPSWLNSLITFLHSQNAQLKRKCKQTHTTPLLQGDMYATVQAKQPILKAIEIIGTSKYRIYFRNWDLKYPITSQRLTKHAQLVWTSPVLNISWHQAKELLTHKIHYSPLSSNHREIAALTKLQDDSISVTPTAPPVFARLLSHQLPQLPPPTDLIICSDGSWTTTPTGPLPHQQITTASAAVIIANKHDPNLYFSCRIDNICQHSQKRAYLQEYIGLAFASIIQQELGSTIPIYSDCEAALKASSKPSPKLYPAAALNDLLSCSRGNRFWIKAHSDRINTINQLSPIERGNIWADKIAGRELNPSVLLSLTTLETAILNLQRWTLFKDNNILLEQLHDCINDQNLVYYCDKKSRKWELELDAVFIGSLLRQSKPGRQRATIMKLMFRKFEDDRLTSEPQTSHVFTCPCGTNCNGRLDDWTTICQHPTIQHERKATLTKIEDLLAAYPSLKRATIQLLTGNQAPLLWRGIWTTPILQNIMEAYNNDCPTQTKQGLIDIQKLLLHLATTLQEAALKLRTDRRWNQRQVTTTRQNQRRHYLPEEQHDIVRPPTRTLLDYGFRVGPT